MSSKIICALFLLFASPFSLLAQNRERGKVLVTLIPSEPTAKIKRVAIRLTSNKGESRFFPRPGKVQERSDTSRVIVLDELPAGTYTLHFLIPSSLKLEQPLKERTITVKEGALLNIEQLLPIQHSPIADAPVATPRQKHKIAAAANEYNGSILLRISSDLPGVALKLSSQELSYPIESKLVMNGSAILWQSPTLPVGEYDLSLYSEESNIWLGTRKVSILPKQTIEEEIDLTTTCSLTIYTNLSKAHTTLTNLSSKKTIEGEGEQQLFSNLPYGTYRIDFSGPEPDQYLAPASQVISLKPGEGAKVSAEYQFTGELTVHSGFAPFVFECTQKNGGRTYTFSSENFSRKVSLPEGLYTISIYRTDSDELLFSQEAYVEGFHSREVKPSH